MHNKNEDNLIESEIGPMVVINKYGKMVCRHPWTSMDIQPNGDITPCCYLPKKIIGNANKESIKEIWNNAKYQDFRKEMSKKGARSVCPSCHILMGMKHWETLSWYKDLDHNSKVYENAVLNENEIFKAKTNLTSKPRRIKYVPSYTCNLNCYHCNQDQYRLKGFNKLDGKIFNQVMEIFPSLQVINPFGGEPFIFPETIDFMWAIVDKNPACRFYTTTNANHFTDEIIDLLSKIKIIKIAVSFDGFSKETYEKYRRGAAWETVLKNTEKLVKIRETNPFALVFNASFNNETYKELPLFIELCKKYKAIGKPVLLQFKPNHTKEFWQKHIKMNRHDLRKFVKLIETATEDKDLPIDTVNSLLDMKKYLRNYPYSEFKIIRNKIKVYTIDLCKKFGLYETIRPLYKKITRR